MRVPHESARTLAEIIGDDDLAAVVGPDGVATLEKIRQGLPTVPDDLHRLLASLIREASKTHEGAMMVRAMVRQVGEKSS